MTEIPEDIMKTARRVLDEALYGGDGLNSIAAAILSERERCAEIALHAPYVEPSRKMFGGELNELYDMQRMLRLVINAKIMGVLP